jgi:hypothetical protein
MHARRVSGDRVDSGGTPRVVDGRVGVAADPDTPIDDSGRATRPPSQKPRTTFLTLDSSSSGRSS